MIKNNIILMLICIITLNANSQSKFGEDEVSCKENLSMFREYYKQKNYVDALKPWRWAYNNCPASSGNIYKNGPKIIKEIMKENPEKKDDYIDTLMMVFDNRIKYFGKRGYVLGLKGYELIGVDRNRSEEGLGYLQESLDLDGNNASVQAVYGYMRAIVNLEKSGARTKEDVIAGYALVADIINYNIKNQSNSTKNFIKYSEKVESLFTPYANCNDLIELFSTKVKNSIGDIDFLKRTIKILENKGCDDSDFFFEALKMLYDIEPTPSLAYEMSKISISNKEVSNAIIYAKHAVDMELDQKEKARYYLALADAYRASFSYSKARDAVYNALDIRDGWGEAYMSLGNIYIAGAKACGSDFDQTTVYWVAVDSFKKAISDEDTRERANKNINTYSKYFPTKETCFFNGLEAGKSHAVGCWINKNTIVRTSD